MIFTALPIFAILGLAAASQLESANFCPKKCSVIAANAALCRAEGFFESSKKAAEASFCIQDCCCEKRQVLVARALYDAAWASSAVVSASTFLQPKRALCTNYLKGKSGLSGLALKGANDCDLTICGCSSRTTRKGYAKAGRLLKEARAVLEKLKCARCEFDCFKIYEEYHQIAREFSITFCYYLSKGLFPCAICPNNYSALLRPFDQCPIEGGLTEFADFLGFKQGLGN